MAPDELGLVCVSALTAEKGVGDLLAALPQLSDLRPRLLLPGEGPLPGALQAEAERLGVAAAVVSDESVAPTKTPWAQSRDS